MAQTVIMLDVGPSMSSQPDDGTPSKLSLAVRAITLFVQRLLDGGIGKVRCATVLTRNCCTPLWLRCFVCECVRVWVWPALGHAQEDWLCVAVQLHAVTILACVVCACVRVHARDAPPVSVSIPAALQLILPVARCLTCLSVAVKL